MKAELLAKRFNKRLDVAIERSGSLLCVGLDPDLSRFPAHLRQLDPATAIIKFNEQIVAATADLVCAYKPNFAFYIAHGLAGIQALLETRSLIPQEIPVILDCKIGDIGNTSEAYAQGLFLEWNFDAITVNPYLGTDSLEPLFKHAQRGLFIVCKTSNAGSGDFQNRQVLQDSGSSPLFLSIACAVQQWDQHAAASLGLVVGATYPEELAKVRAACPHLPILLPGIGSQQGDLGAALAAGLVQRDRGLVVNSSRGIMFAGSGKDFADDARKAALALRDEINLGRSESRDRSVQTGS